MDFMWRDYCPRVFRRLRKAAGIDEADYMLSLAGAQALRQLNSPGKSGSMFLLSGERQLHGETHEAAQIGFPLSSQWRSKEIVLCVVLMLLLVLLPLLLLLLQRTSASW